MTTAETTATATAEAPPRRRKPPVRRVPSDDCLILVDGEAFYPHTGEWVEVQAGVPVAAWREMDIWFRLRPRLQTIMGDPDEITQMYAIMAEGYETAFAHLARLLKRWNWTDDDGQPLPPVDGTATPFRTLRPEEVWWLLRATERDTPSDEKNGSRP